MNKRLTSLLLIILLGGCCCPGFNANLAAQPASNSTASSTGNLPDHTVYLTGTENVWNTFPKCPALGSEIDQSDLLITLSIQASRTIEQKKEAFQDNDYSIKLVTALIDPAFDVKYQHVFHVLNNADGDAYVITAIVKKANGRLRPYVQHPILVQPLVTSGDFSYPSGHASGMELQARILGTLFPNQADALLNRARQIADSRVVAGVNYTSDTEAGLTLGDLLFTELEANDKFKNDLSTAETLDKISTK